MLIDSYGRIHNYLRISLTDNCNFRCAYCMPHDDINFTPDSRLMRADEIYSLSEIMVGLGVTKIRLTGGEPLMRRDFSSIVEQISMLPVSLHLTTNGVLLHKHEALLKSGVFHGINISIDTLDRDRFTMLTKRDALDVVLRNIQLCLYMDIRIKLNVVMLNGVNERELDKFVAMTIHDNIHVRFIEYMPFDQNEWAAHKVITSATVLQQLREKYAITKLEDQPNDTDTKFKVEGAIGTFAFISTLSQAFCSSCNRMRITADGKMKNCLFGYEEFDLLTPMRSGQDIKSIIRECIYRKHAQLGGQFDNYETLDATILNNRSMIKIGG